MLEVKLNYEKNEPRYKGLNTLDDAFKFYKEKRKGNPEFDKKQFKEICYTFLKEAVKYVIEGNHFKIPFGLGTFFIEKRKNKLDKLKVDWESTVKLWDEKWGRGLDKTAYTDIKDKPLVKFLNNHTKGHYYRWHWTRGRINNITMYSFIPVRSVTRGLAKAIKDGGKDYLKR